MDFWNDKDDEYKFRMVDVYREQVQDLNVMLPTFKVANATIHFDETSPHMHIVGVPIIGNCKRGMKKQVGKMGCYLKADQLFVYRWAYPRCCEDGYHLADSQGCGETGRPSFQKYKKIILS